MVALLLPPLLMPLLLLFLVLFHPPPVLPVVVVTAVVMLTQNARTGRNDKGWYLVALVFVLLRMMTTGRAIAITPL